MRLYLILFLLNFSLFSENYSQSKINWIELNDNTEINNNGKKMIIDLYTDWCGWCKVMDRNTFTDSNVISHINELIGIFRSIYFIFSRLRCRLPDDTGGVTSSALSMVLIRWR